MRAAKSMACLGMAAKRMGARVRLRYTARNVLLSTCMKWLSERITRFLNAERLKPGHPLSDLATLKRTTIPGDVILVEGVSRVSDVIRWVTLSPWTHAALSVGCLRDIRIPELRDQLSAHFDGPDDEPLLVESFLGRGTIVQPLATYEGYHLRMARPSGLKRADAERVVAYAISRIGAPYDVRQIFDLLRFLFPWFILPKRWRSSLFARNSGTATKTVCSTMIAQAFGQVQFPILPLVVRQDGGLRFYRRNPKLCTPSDFDYSPYFEIIKYPLLDQRGYDAIDWHAMSELDEGQQGLYVDLEYTASILDLPEGKD